MKKRPGTKQPDKALPARGQLLAAAKVLFARKGLSGTTIRDIANQAKIMAHGCPVGTLCNELAKLDHAALPRAGAIFTLFRDWLGREFARLGYAADTADALAMELLVRSQGVATLASAFRDEAFIRREVAQMRAWLDAKRLA